MVGCEELLAPQITTIIKAFDRNPWRYSGEYLDVETGTYYLRARYYQPTTGRFLTEDIVRPGTNWYVYCSNNPVSFIDSSGLAEYRVGDLSQAPQFVHDSGLQFNPDAVATDADRTSGKQWGWMAFGAHFAPNLVDAANMYSHINR